MQTYGQNRTPQQQMFNRFPQRFQQPQPVAQPAQGPVYADQSLNAPGNQPQQFQQPQYGRFGRGFMPQNRGGYDRQMDQLRGGYNRPMPQIMPQQDLGINSGYFQQSPELNILATREAKYPTAGQTQIPTFAQPYVQKLQGGQQPVAGQPATGYESAPSLGGQAPAGGKGGNPTSNGPTEAQTSNGPTQAQLNPFQAALVKGGTPYVQGAPGAPYAIGQGIPGGAPGGYMPLMNSNGTPVSSLASANPAGGKGGNPTSNGSTGQYQ
jgi:hypothetical protein